jgi:FkbM family methyltransferase
MAARRLAKKYSLHMIEAEPQHVQWITTHMDDNDIRPSNYHVHPYLIGRRSVAPFVVISPEQGMTPRTWYGQAAWWGAQDSPDKSEVDYLGHKATMHDGGWGTIDVECRPLHEILANVPSIDFIDMDIQGAEADAIELSIDFLCERVKRLYIGTHTPEVEQRLRRSLESNGWTPMLDYKVGTTVETEYGSIAFGDGVQFWINPRKIANRS